MLPEFRGGHFQKSDTPKIAKIEVVTRGKVRRAKLNYLRERVGKEAVTVKTIR